MSCLRNLIFYPHKIQNIKMMIFKAEVRLTVMSIAKVVFMMFKWDATNIIWFSTTEIITRRNHIFQRSENVLLCRYQYL